MLGLFAASLASTVTLYALGTNVSLRGEVGSFSWRDDAHGMYDWYGMAFWIEDPGCAAAQWDVSESLIGEYEVDIYNPKSTDACPSGGHQYMMRGPTSISNNSDECWTEDQLDEDCQWKVKSLTKVVRVADIAGCTKGDCSPSAFKAGVSAAEDVCGTTARAFDTTACAACVAHSKRKSSGPWFAPTAAGGAWECHDDLIDAPDKGTIYIGSLDQCTCNNRKS